MYSIPQDIDDYSLHHSSAEDPLLSELAAFMRAHTERSHMMTGHVEGSLLRLLVQSSGAKTVLEVGTFTGYAALSMAMGLPDDGKLITCDIDPVATKIAREFWARSSHGRKIELRLAPALETITSLNVALDLVFIDADKPSYVAYWNAVLSKVRRGGLVLADNTLFYRQVLDPKEPNAVAIAAFNEHVLKDERVELVLLTVRDGITLARKK